MPATLLYFNLIVFEDSMHDCSHCCYRRFFLILSSVTKRNDDFWAFRIIVFFSKLFHKMATSVFARLLEPTIILSQNFWPTWKITLVFAKTKMACSKYNVKIKASDYMSLSILFELQVAHRPQGLWVNHGGTISGNISCQMFIFRAHRVIAMTDMNQLY